MLTVHERLTAPGVVIQLPRCRALARKAGVRSDCGHDPHQARLQATSWSPLDPEPESAQHKSSRIAALVTRTPGDEARGGKAFDEGDDLDLSAPRLNFAGADHGIYAVVAAPEYIARPDEFECLC